MKSKSIKPLGKLELEIMQIIWRSGEVTVRQVLNIINQDKDLAYTTVMTIMQNLEKKNYLQHVERNRTYYYNSKVNKESVERRVLTDVISDVFNGSPTRLVNTLLDNPGLSEKDLTEIKKLFELKK